MLLRERLASGDLGIRFELPAHLEVVTSDADALRASDPERGVEWWVFFGDDVHLDLLAGQRDALGAALEAYARAIFVATHAQLGVEGPPRTDDPTWAAMVDIEHRTVDGAPALVTVHRTAYTPGHEIVMGHLLVPLRGGLFEVRLCAGDSTTGLRESVLSALAGRDGDEPRRLTQSEMDDPRHDPQFAELALSQVRASLRDVAERGNLRVLAPAAPRADGEVEIERLGCAFVPPRGFVRAGEEAGSEVFTRTSFCVHDGVECLLVERGDEVIGARELGRHAASVSRRGQEESDIRELTLHVEELAPIDGRAQVLVIADGAGYHERRRTAYRWFLDDAGHPWYLAISASDAVPAATRANELDQAARSWRSTVSRAALDRRPWWKVW